MNFAKVEQVLKINGDIYNINDIVRIKFSECTLRSGKNMEMRIPTITAIKTGRIIDILGDSFEIDCSKEYNADKEKIFYGDIIEIWKFNKEG